MPCYRPIKIQNTVKAFDPMHSPYDLIVPCGKCEQCNKNKRMEWEIRSYYEWQNSIENGGFSAFLTLTYDRNHLPSIKFLDDSLKFPCFSKRDVQLYLKRIRKALPELKNNIKYLCTSEYGDKKHRPHYHIIFYVSKPYNINLFKKVVQKCWTSGHTQVGKDGFLINRFAGIKYVTKYITKDENDNSYYKLLSDKLINPKNALFTISDTRYDLRTLDFDEYEISVKAITNDLKPFHLQSQGLGISILQKLTPLQIKYSTVKVPSKNGYIDLPIPQYIIRKLFYNCLYSADKSTCVFRLNQLGLDVLCEGLFSKIGDSMVDFQNTIDNIEPVDVTYINKYNGSLFKDVEDVQVTIKELLGIRDLHMLSIYNIVYRGISFHKLDFEFLDSNFPLLFDNDFILNEYKIQRPIQTTYQNIKDSHSIFCYKNSCGSTLLYNSLPCFCYFDEILKILRALKSSQLKRESIKQSDDEKKLIRLKQYLNELNYES